MDIDVLLLSSAVFQIDLDFILWTDFLPCHGICQCISDANISSAPKKLKLNVAHHSCHPINILTYEQYVVLEIKL